MISSIYNSPYVLTKSGGRKGKSKKEIEKEEKAIIASFKRLKLKDKKFKDKILSAINKKDLTDWENEFLKSLLKFKKPSLKQLEILNKILVK